MTVPVRRTVPFAAAALLALGAAPAIAAYPDKPIRIVVTFAAGGASDIVARIISEPLAKALGQPVIVDNKPGAGGTLGGLDVMRAAPDGYTLMLSNSTPLSIGPFTVPKQPYDPVKQFSHVALLGVAPVLIMANPKVGPATLKDLPKAAAARRLQLRQRRAGVDRPHRRRDDQGRDEAADAAHPVQGRRADDHRPDRRHRSRWASTSSPPTCR